MPWYRINGMSVHMRGTRLPPACVAIVGIGDTFQRCAAMSGFFCDWPAGGGRTCDRPLCERHAVEVGKNRHYCQEHYAEHLDQQAQRGLFTHLVQP